MPYGISILIACFNSAKVIEQTLRYVQNQEAENISWEVILIDNNSTDHTSDIAKNCWNFNKNANLRIVKEEKVGLSNARLRGYKEAKYDIISFVDDDNLIPSNWVKYQYEIFKNPEIGVLGCTSIGKFDYQPPIWYEKFKLNFATGKLYEDNFIDVTSDGAVYGAGMTMRKQIYTDLIAQDWNPYLSGRIGNKQTGGEDSELTYAARLLGYKIFYSNQINTQHFILEDRLSWTRLLKMTAGFGESDVFTLPYTLIYRERMGENGLILILRKKWWFNYLGKKTMLILRNLQSKVMHEEGNPIILHKIRTQAFCEYIFQNRKKFEESFKEIEKLKALNTKKATIV